MSSRRHYYSFITLDAMRRARSRRMFSEMDVVDRGAVYRPV